MESTILRIARAGAVGNNSPPSADRTSHWNGWSAWNDWTHPYGCVRRSCMIDIRRRTYHDETDFTSKTDASSGQIREHIMSAPITVAELCKQNGMDARQLAEKSGLDEWRTTAI